MPLARYCDEISHFAAIGGGMGSSEWEGKSEWLRYGAATAAPATRRGVADLLAELDAVEGRVEAEVLAALLRSVRPDLLEMRPWLRFGSRTYRRNLLRRRPHYEALLLCWRPGQHSPVHDHRGSSGAVAVLTGEATEVCFGGPPGGPLRAATYQRLPAGSVVSSSDDDIHLVANWSRPARPLVTLHVYSPPLSGMQIYPREQIVPVSATEVDEIDSPPRRARVIPMPSSRLRAVREA